MFNVHKTHMSCTAACVGACNTSRTSLAHNKGQFIKNEALHVILVWLGQQFRAAAGDGWGSNSGCGHARDMHAYLMAGSYCSCSKGPSPEAHISMAAFLQLLLVMQDRRASQKHAHCITSQSASAHRTRHKRQQQAHTHTYSPVPLGGPCPSAPVGCDPLQWRRSAR